MFRTRALAAGCAAVSLLAFAAPTMAKPDAADGVTPFTRDVFDGTNT